MTTWTHRERVLAAFAHQEPDRVPIDMMGNATMLVDQTYFVLRNHLGLAPIPPVRRGTTANYYDERILAHLDIDFRRIFLRERPAAWAAPDDGPFGDPWGIRFARSGPFVNLLESPLRNAATVEQVVSHAWPRADDLFSAAGLVEEARRMYDETDYALVARNPVTAGFLDRACQLMGATEFLTCLAAAPEVAHAIIAHLLAIYKDIYAMFLDAVGPYVQMVEVADDLGTQNGLLISPKMYREFIKPAERELYGLIHEKAPHAALFRHCDGTIAPLIPDLIEVGVDVLNPVQTSSKGMVAQHLKATFGKTITFHGSVEGMERPIDCLVTEVKQRIEAFASGGGFVLASCNHMVNVPPENILAMFATAREYGRCVVP
jgi:uroporphyrinogen decarboxylase